MAYINHCQGRRLIKEIYWLEPDEKHKPIYKYQVLRLSHCPRCDHPIMNWQGYGIVRDGIFLNKAGTIYPIKRKHQETWLTRTRTHFIFKETPTVPDPKDTRGKPIVSDWTQLICRPVDQVASLVLKRV